MHASRVIAFIFLLLSSIAMHGAGAALQIAPGSGQFSFTDEQGDATKHMTVYTYVPAGVTAQAAAIVFVLHGAGKNARGYRDTWIPHADKHGFMIVAPLFDSEQWSRGTYSYASIVGRDGKPQDPSLWSFNVIEHLFDAI
ncbi:MAG TPA: hypothetical protein VFI62_16140, partial [Burkholderiales bacterium]|nr:hypothetical protein [Burkholderiales bacterium]